MDHSYIEASGLVDRYARGRMPVDERVAFEDHFMDCPQCLEQLEMARSFIEGVRITAAEAAERPKSQAEPVATWFTCWSSWRIAGLATAVCLVVFAAPTTWLMLQLEDTRVELGRAKLASANLKRQVEAEPAVYILNEFRGPDTGYTGPATRITIPESLRQVVFAIEQDLSLYPMYRVTIRNADGKTVWQQSALAPSSPDAIGISFPSNILSPGDYTVSLAALTPAGQVVPLGKYTFRAMR